MHRSRLSTLVVDVSAGRAAEAVHVWSSALGAAVGELPDEPASPACATPCRGS